MAYSFSDTQAGLQPIALSSDVQKHPIGTRVFASDPLYGEGEFIYLKGVASTVIGDAVIYDTYNNTTKRAVAGDRGPVGFSMSANVANQFGWYQIAGMAVAKTTTVAAAGNCYLTATAGQLDDLTVAGDKIDGARFKSADGTPAAGFALAQITFPCLNGNG